MITKIVKPQRRVHELEKIQTICRTSLQTRNPAAIPCVATFSENYNDRVIDASSLCRQSAEDVDIHSYIPYGHFPAIT